MYGIEGLKFQIGKSKGKIKGKGARKLKSYKEELPIDFNLKKFEDIPKLIEEYIYYDIINDHHTP